MKDLGKKARDAVALRYNQGVGDVVDNGLKTPYGNPATVDQIYEDQRPRDLASQREAFRRKNPEFKDVAHLGDWTSINWTKDV